MVGKSCVIEELWRKIMAKPGKYRDESVFFKQGETVLPQ